MPDFSAWVLRAGITGFTAGCRALQPDTLRFGDLVKTQRPDQPAVYGLIGNVTVRADPLIDQLILADVLEPELALGRRQTGLALIELNIVTVGYRRPEEGVIYGLPPQPPASLDVLTVCGETELRTFSASLIYLPFLLTAPGLPADDLLAAHLFRAWAARPPETRSQFLLAAGRELARLLGKTDPVRLEGVLKQIKALGATLPP